ncbi:capsular polysaccharide transport system permease protein [Falsiroseomonas stagni DSM 19981]|uniref:Capsular polysaccharide transport system permease protein n=2 Tax=Falsiroseomonas TaxID=2870713 RepID=A0A1I3Y261_9PROT|nr:capsular polysaccharide transport system permease protein [Falsiroseomonas stagni DSM 19981]
MKLSPPIRPSETLPASGVEDQRLPPRLPPKRRWRRSLLPQTVKGWYMLLVLLPTLLVGTYYATYAADLYESESRILVRGRGAPAAGGAGGIVAAVTGGRGGMDEARAVAAYIDSLDALAGLRRSLDLVAIWRRPEADLVSRLTSEEPAAERLLRYYRRRVTVSYDIETNITTLRVLAYRPGDARDIAEALIVLSENLVNRFSARTAADTIRVAREEVEIAERRVTAARDALNNFREREQALDPTRSAGAAVENVSRLEALLAQTRAELQEKRAFMRPDNPQIQVLNNRIAALVAQVGAERARSTRGEEGLTQQLSGYERLQLEREFAEKQLTSAISSLENARADAQRQAVFLMRVVEPNLPERASHPRGRFNTLTIFAGLTILFGIGWLMVAGAREHAS